MSKLNEGINRISKRINKKILIGVVLCAVFSGGYVFARSYTSNRVLDKSLYTVIHSGKSINKINAKGDVKGEKKVEVYSEVTLPIKEVKVEEGDKVQKGQVLAVLDVSSLEDKIKELEADIETTENENIKSIENSKAAYDSALKLSNEENNFDIQNASSALEVAKTDYENKKNIYESNKILFDNGGISKQDLRNYEIEYENSESIYKKSVVALDNIKEKVQLNLTTCKNNYEAALIKNNDNSKKITLANLKDDLMHDKIIASSDGIITSKKACAGNQSSGTLFEIQNEDNISVILKVKEVDIEKINLNQSVEIKTDSMGDEIINGQVVDIKSIALANDDLLNLEGDEDDKEAEYEVKVKINDGEYKPRIGMSVQADIVISEKDNVYSIPIESIVKDQEDNDSVYIAQKQEDKYIVKSVKVTKGTENDSNVEISGEEIKENVIVLKSPMDYKIGSSLNIKEE